MAKYDDIFDAIGANDIEAVKSFLPEQLEARDQFGRTPLFRTFSFFIKIDIEITRLLLDSGADITARDNNGMTPLHTACDNNEHKKSELLMMRGADPMATDNLGLTALDFDNTMVKDKDGNKIPHKEILMQLRTEYLMNKHALEESERTAALSSGWEMEM